MIMSDLAALSILPLPCGGRVSPEAALEWLREDYPAFQCVAINVAACAAAR